MSSHATSGRRSIFASETGPQCVVSSSCAIRSISASFASQPPPALLIDKPQPMGQRRQPAVGIVGPQQQPVFGPAGEHAVRLVDAARDQVVDHHADIRLIAAEHQRLFGRGAPAPRWRRR